MTCNSILSAWSGWQRIAAVLSLGLLFAVGCNNTPRVVQSWKDPSLTGPMTFKKIMVIATHPDVLTRKAAEDELVRQIGPDRAVPADQILTDADRKDIEKIKAKVKQSGVDAVVASSIGTVTSHGAAQRDINPYSYDSFWHNYDNDIGAPDRTETPGYASRIVSVRTQIFSTASEKMVWEGVTELSNPQDLRTGVADVVKAVRKQFAKSICWNKPGLKFKRLSLRINRLAWIGAMPHRTRIKFCGITRAEDAVAAAEAGADAIGLFLHGESRRLISREVARQIIAALPPFVTPVGLFVDAHSNCLRKLPTTLD